MEQDDANDLETLLSRALSAQLAPVATALDAAARRLSALETFAKSTAAGVIQLEGLASSAAAGILELQALAASASESLERIETRLAPIELVTGFLAANTAAANVTRLAELEARILVLEQQRRSS